MDTTDVLLKGVYALYDENRTGYSMESILEDTLLRMLDSDEIVNIYGVYVSS